MKNLITIGQRVDDSDADVKIDVGALIYSRACIQANSGAGKSGLLRVIAEQVAARIPTIIIDKEGEFHTLREKIDLVLVGEQGELAADARSAALLARRLIELHASAVIDLSSYTKAKLQQEFVAIFLDALINLPKRLWHPTFIIIDEAQFFFPEKGFGESVATQAGVDFMTLGRKRAFGGILVTPRLAMLNNNVANANNIFIGRTGLDTDQTRVGRALGMKPKDAIVLRDLKTREFYAFGPELNFNGVAQFRVADCHTTIPKAGDLKSLTPPKASTVVKDLAAKLADLPAQAEAEIRSLTDAKKRIQELATANKALTDGLSSRPEDVKRIEELEAALQKAYERTRKVVEKKILTEPQLKRLEKDLEKAEALLDRATEAMNSTVLKDSLHNMRNALCELTTPLSFDHTLERLPPVGPLSSPPTQPSRPTREGTAGDSAAAAASNGNLKPGPAKVLSALIQYPSGLEKPSLIVLTGYKATSAYEFTKELIRAGYAVKKGNTFLATAEGKAALPNAKPLPTGSALRAEVEQRLPPGEWAVLRLLVDAKPGSLSKAQLIAGSGYKGTSTYEYIKKLKARKLVDGDASAYTASDNLF